MQDQQTPIQPERSPDTELHTQASLESTAAEHTSEISGETENEAADMTDDAASVVASEGDDDLTSDDDSNEENVDEEEEEDSLEDDPELRGILESLIFASDEPLTFRQIKDIIAPDANQDDGNDEQTPVRRRRKKKSFTITRVKRGIDMLNAEYAEQGRSFRIIEVSGGFAFQTTPDFGNWVGKLFAERSRRRLTQSALETLAIIAFRQPMSKPAVEGIRGVNAEHVVKSLLERNLISIVGREDSPGRPLLYGTTKTFLRHFGLSSINDLPRPREIKDLLAAENELAMNPIEEMDPAKAAELTRVSSQELERLFDTARQRDGDDDSAPENGSGAPELHVQFDSENSGAIALDEIETPTETTDDIEESAPDSDDNENDMMANDETLFDEEEPDDNERM
jgi:segregation and condensation protein B